MSSVMVSGRSFTAAANVATEAARRLGYELAGFDHLVDDAASMYSAPPEKLRAALMRPPSLLGMADRSRRRLAKLVVAACCARLDHDEFVLHVPFAVGIAPGISHVLRARVTASLDQRAMVAADELRLAVDKAARRVADDDRDAAAISTMVFGTSDDDRLYDEVVQAGSPDTERAVDRLVRAASERRYLATSYSRRCASELAVSRGIEAVLAAREIDAAVALRDGHATVRAHAAVSKRAALGAAVEAVASRFPVLAEIEFVWVDDLFDTYAASMR